MLGRRAKVHDIRTPPPFELHINPPLSVTFSRALPTSRKPIIDLYHVKGKCKAPTSGCRGPPASAPATCKGGGGRNERVIVDGSFGFEFFFCGMRNKRLAGRVEVGLAAKERKSRGTWISERGNTERVGAGTARQNGRGARGKRGRGVRKHVSRREGEGRGYL